jgi:hypothetical protein
MHKSALIFLLGLMVILLPFGTSINIISSAIAQKNPYMNNNDYTQRYERFYKDDGFREVYYNYHKQHHQQEQQQIEQIERYQQNDNAYGYNSNYNDNANYYDTYNDEGYDYPPEKPIFDSLQTEGTFFVIDAGQAHGGFEFTAEYKAEFTVTNGIGTLTITQIIGLGDPLEKHVYSITDLKIDKNNKITMNIDGNPVELVFVESDEFWNHQFDKHYIASCGGFSPENEIKGVISPLIFPGLPDFWYVELRIPATY